jgi:endonuclease/exonuclease/phosphatase family metal-dependent hydrolase
MKNHPRIPDSPDGRIPGRSFVTSLLAFILALGIAGQMPAAPGNYPLYEQTYIGVVTANQQSDAIEVYKPAFASTAWSTPVWDFKPATADNWTSTEVSQWADPVDVKLRNVAGSGGLCLVASSSRYVVVAKRQAGAADKDKVWSVDVGTGFDLQGVEMLPNGNVFVASRANHWVRLYQLPGSSSFGTFSLTNARAVLWDPTNNIAWVSGQVGSNQVLTAVSVGSSNGNPTLIEVAARQSIAPSVIRDIAPFVGDHNKLWVATDAALYIYDKTTKAFTTAAGSRNSLSSAGSHVSGYSVQLRITGTSTNAVDFYALNGASVYTQTKTGAQFVRAGAFNPNYEYREEIAFGSYNIRQSGATSDTGKLHWNIRRALVMDMIRKYAFDIFGVQEARGDQVGHIVSDLPEYAYVGISRDPDPASEHSAIYYKKGRFDLQGSGTFWLAPGGPTVVPNTAAWGATYRRICTWARFLDRTNGRHFWVFNTHWEHAPAGVTSRLNSGPLILDRIRLRAGNVPAILMGDLNAGQTWNEYYNLLADLDDAHDTAQISYDPLQGTGNGWDPDYDQNWRIDHVFHSPGWQVKSHNVLTDHYINATYNPEPIVLPSDHFPVLVEAKLTGDAPQNVALGGLVDGDTSVENYGWFEPKATDGNQPSISGALGWSSALGIASVHSDKVKVDLGSVRNLNTVSLFARDDGANLGSGFPANFTVEVSSNGTSWVPVATRTAYPQPSNPDGLHGPRQDFLFQQESARFVRVSATGIPANAMMQFAEIEASYSWPNRAVERSVVYSTTYTGSGWSPASATDGTRRSWAGGMGYSSGTTGSNANHTEWVGVNLGSQQLIQAVELYPRNDGTYIGHGFPIDFTLQVSNDGTNWSPVLTVTNHDQPTDGRSRRFTLNSSVNAQYVRVHATTLRPNAGAYHLQFAEIEIY